MEMDELVREFKKFLKERNLLEAFLNGVLRKYENLYTSNDPIRDFCLFRPTVAHKWIDYGLVWSASPLGHFRWSAIDQEWTEKYQTLTDGRED